VLTFMVDTRLTLAVSTEVLFEAECRGSRTQADVITTTKNSSRIDLSNKLCLIAQRHVSCMQTRVREDFSSAPLRCAFCQKCKRLKKLARKFGSCPQFFPQAGVEMFANLCWRANLQQGVPRSGFGFQPNLAALVVNEDYISAPISSHCATIS
jgi:hypothetical protein